MTWKDKLELGLKEDALFGRSPEIPLAHPKHRARVARLVARGRYSRDTRAVLERVQPDVAYETRFRRRSFATGRLIRRAGGIARTGTDVALTTPSVVEPNNNLDAPPTPR